MKKSLIFMPVNKNIEFYSAYDCDNHWRYLKPERNYETVLCKFQDFDVEPNTYDYMLPQKKGFKFELVKYFLDTFDYSNYEYVGFFDDDLVTDIKSINRALEIAKENDLKIFQMSLTDGSHLNHPITEQNKNLKYTTTNFVECMAPFYHVSLIEKFRDLWNYYNFKSGWGLDCVITDIFKMPSAVIHEVSLYHKPAPAGSTYNRGSAHQEMLDVWHTFYPKYMKAVYNEDVFFDCHLQEFSQHR
jgi:hypothetical protein